MLNWIVWNRTDYLYKMTYKGWYALKLNQPTNLSKIHVWFSRKALSSYWNIKTTQSSFPRISLYAELKPLYMQ